LKQKLRTPGEARLQLVNVLATNTGSGRVVSQFAFGRKQHRIKPRSIQVRQNEQQHALGAADLTGVVVE
jgi:hypothetical protein